MIKSALSCQTHRISASLKICDMSVYSKNMTRRSETEEDPQSMGYGVPPKNLLKLIDIQRGLDYAGVS